MTTSIKRVVEECVFWTISSVVHQKRLMGRVIQALKLLARLFRPSELFAKPIGQTDNNDGTVDCHFLLSDRSGQYILVVPAGRDGYHIDIQRHAGFNRVVRLLCEICRPGDTVFDLGANLGSISVPLSVRRCKIFAFDVLPENISLLERAARKNELYEFEVVGRAVWRNRATLRIAGDAAWGRVDPSGDMAVEAISIDEFVQERNIRVIDVIKLDVEGAELPALEGMRNVLTKLAPFVVFEANVLTCGQAGYSIHDLFRFFNTMDYQLYRIYRNTLAPFSPNDAQELVVCDYLAVRARLPHLTSFRIGPVSTAELLLLMQTSSLESPLHRKYIWMQRHLLPIELLQNRAFASKLGSWADAPVEERTMEMLQTGCMKYSTPTGKSG